MAITANDTTALPEHARAPGASSAPATSGSPIAQVAAGHTDLVDTILDDIESHRPRSEGAVNDTVAESVRTQIDGADFDAGEREQFLNDLAAQADGDQLMVLYDIFGEKPRTGGHSLNPFSNPQRVDELPDTLRAEFVEAMQHHADLGAWQDFIGHYGERAMDSPEAAGELGEIVRSTHDQLNQLEARHNRLSGRDSAGVSQETLDQIDGLKARLTGAFAALNDTGSDVPPILQPGQERDDFERGDTGVLQADNALDALMFAGIEERSMGRGQEKYANTDGAVGLIRAAGAIDAGAIDGFNGEAFGPNALGEIQARAITSGLTSINQNSNKLSDSPDHIDANSVSELLWASADLVGASDGNITDHMASVGGNGFEQFLRTALNTDETAVGAFVGAVRSELDNIAERTYAAAQVINDPDASADEKAAAREETKEIHEYLQGREGASEIRALQQLESSLGRVMQAEMNIDRSDQITNQILGAVASFAIGQQFTGPGAGSIAKVTTPQAAAAWSEVQRDLGQEARQEFADDYGQVTAVRSPELATRTVEHQGEQVEVQFYPALTVADLPAGSRGSASAEGDYSSEIFRELQRANEP